MTRLLETPISSTQTSLPSKTKFVDNALCSKAFSLNSSDIGNVQHEHAGKSELAQKLAAGGHLGNRFLKERLFAHLSQPDVSKSEFIQDFLNAGSLLLTKAEARKRDFHDLADEEKDVKRAARYTEIWRQPSYSDDYKKRRNHTHIDKHLPPEWLPFLEKMSPAKRRQREIAILDRVGWDGLELIGLRASDISQKANDMAHQHWKQFPDKDENGNAINQEPAHMKGRCKKHHRRKLKKLQRKALLYVEAALSAVGGAKSDMRPLYVSDYTLALHREYEEETALKLEELRLINVDDPSVQIPMSEVNKRAKIANVTKRRLLIDMMLKRWEILGWHVCWITVTLPGAYVPHSTNEACRAAQWNTEYGPLEGMKAMQDDHHRVLALLRDKGVRPSGWWNAQPQQSGTVHRHYVLACQTQEHARVVCDEFRKKFSSRLKGDDAGQDRGCAAFVIGDGDKKYAPPKGKNGQKETAASIAKYAARYSTRLETEADQQKIETVDPDTGEILTMEKPTDLMRFKAWKWMRRLRTHNFLGLDSGRGPLKIWDVFWKKSGQNIEARDGRAATAMRLMQRVRDEALDAAHFRKLADEAKNDEDRDEMLQDVMFHNDEAAQAAWHAAVAIGMWNDADLDEAELQWLSDELSEYHEMELHQSLPPLPIRDTVETSYNEETRKNVGVFCPSTNERFMAVDGEWKIVDLLEAEAMLEEFKENNKQHMVGSSSDKLSLNPTDPSISLSASLGSLEPKIDTDDPPF